MKNDRKSQQALYNLYYGYVASIVLRYDKRPNMASATCNDCFLKVFQKIHLYPHEWSFKAWMRKVVIHHIIDELRKKDPMKLVDNTDFQDLSFQHPSLNQIDPAMDMDDLLALLDSMPLPEKAIFNLHVIDGFSHEEIADILNIGVRTSKRHLAKARSWMQQRIKLSEPNKDVSNG